MLGRTPTRRFRPDPIGPSGRPRGSSLEARIRRSLLVIALVPILPGSIGDRSGWPALSSGRPGSPPARDEASVPGRLAGLISGQPCSIDEIIPDPPARPVSPASLARDGAIDATTEPRPNPAQASPGRGGANPEPGPCPTPSEPNGSFSLRRINPMPIGSLRPGSVEAGTDPGPTARLR